MSARRRGAAAGPARVPRDRPGGAEAAPAGRRDAPDGGEAVRAGRRDRPGGAEAVRAERRARAATGPAAQPPPGAGQGRLVIRSAWAGTAVFAVVAVVAAVVPAARVLAVMVDLALLAGGSGLYLWGWAMAAGRSRDDEISLWNLILLEDVAPPKVRWQLLGALGAQVAVAAATCWISSALAFGWLVPLWGLAHCEYWGARYGAFPPRERPPGGGEAGVPRRSGR